VVVPAAVTALRTHVFEADEWVTDALFRADVAALLGDCLAPVLVDVTWMAGEIGLDCGGVLAQHAVVWADDPRGTAAQARRIWIEHSHGRSISSIATLLGVTSAHVTRTVTMMKNLPASRRNALSSASVGGAR
jgi:hypothetical protein